MSNTKLSHRLSAVALNLGVAVIGIIVAYPLLWMVSASFKSVSEIYQFPPTLIPDHLTFANYDRLFKEWAFSAWYGNSLAVAIISTLGVLFFTSLAGFGFAKYRFRGKNALFFLMLSSTMVPFQLILVPLYLQMSQLKWTNSYTALIIPFLAPAVGIFQMRQFMNGIPGELMEAARLDGASEFGIYWRIMLPLARPALAALAVLTFLGSWNSYLWPLTVLRSPGNLTLPVGVGGMIGGVTAGSEPPVAAAMAAATLVTIPIIIVFVSVQKQYVAGLTAASVKE
jgi:multiple sugar transport system permease protein